MNKLITLSEAFLRPPVFFFFFLNNFLSFTVKCTSSNFFLFFAKYDFMNKRKNNIVSIRRNCSTECERHSIAKVSDGSFFSEKLLFLHGCSAIVEPETGARDIQWYAMYITFMN